MKLFYALPVVALALTIWVFADKKNSSFSKAMITVLETSPEQPTSPVKKSKEQWEKELSPIEYHVLINEGTEPPNGSVYQQFKKQGEGVYYCAACGAELFSSDEKFDSRSGWPSFFDPSEKENIKLSVDHKIGYKRVEVRCAKCDGHLGHLFEGEGFDTPTDKRYCINGVCLNFLPED